jgi:hypothetical protein
MQSYPPELRFPSLKASDYKTKYYYFSIDSRDRDRTAWPSTSEYQVRMEPDKSFIGATLGRNYKNVKSLELMNAVYPNTSNVLQEPYLFVCIPELENKLFDATNIIGMRAFAKLIPHHNTTYFVYSESGYDDPAVLEYHTAGERLDKLTIQFRKHDGSVFDFGADAASNLPPISSIQTSLTFKVGVVEPAVPN